MDMVRLKQAGTLVVRGINHLLWPAVCSSCRENICETDDNLCMDCWEQLRACSGGDYCPQCGRDVSKYGLVQGRCGHCQGKEFHFDAIARAGIYDMALRRMILAFKSADRTQLDSTLGFLADSALQGSSFYGDIDCFVPVPLHWSRRLWRGYNQSLLITKRLNRNGAKISTDLVRIRRTKTQPAMVNAAKRAANVADAFAVRRGHDLAGQNICLVDDIKTTGATLNECAKILKQAGAKNVFALVLAVAGQNPFSSSR
jgi:ComF family protein